MRLTESIKNNLLEDGTQIETLFPNEEVKIDGSRVIYRVNNGEESIGSIHPYDETDYHYAVKRGDIWNIYRIEANGVVLKDAMKGAQPYEVALEMINLDRKMGLKRTGGIN